MEHIEYTQQKPAAGNYILIADQYQTYYAVVSNESEVDSALDYFRSTYDWNCDMDMSAEELAKFIENAPDPVKWYEYHAAEEVAA